jgi:hypothetical protein
VLVRYPASGEAHVRRSIRQLMGPIVSFP